MLFIDSLHKIYYCPLKDNRQVDDSGGQQPYRRVDALSWTTVSANFFAPESHPLPFQGIMHKKRRQPAGPLWLLAMLICRSGI